MALSIFWTALAWSLFWLEFLSFSPRELFCARNPLGPSSEFFYKLYFLRKILFFSFFGKKGTSWYHQMNWSRSNAFIKTDTLSWCHLLLIQIPLAWKSSFVCFYFPVTNAPLSLWTILLLSFVSLLFLFIYLFILTSPPRQKEINQFIQFAQQVHQQYLN